MASVKVCLRKRATAENTHAIFIQIIKDRKKSIITLGHNIALKDWDEDNRLVKKSHPNSARLNNAIAKKLAEAHAKLLDMEANNTDTSPRAISSAFKKGKENTFLKQAAIYLQQLEQAGKFNRLSSDKPRVERFKEFLGNNDIYFPEITPTLLKRFQAYLKGTRTITERTVVNHLVVIRTIFNQAITAKLVDPKYYPFGKGGIIIKFPDTLKIGLTAEDIAAIEKADLTDTQAIHARNLWLFSFYFAGMRISDVMRLKWADFQNDRLFYKMGKNDKGGSLKVPVKALAILAQYRREASKHDLVFPDLEPLESLTNALKLQAYIKVRIKVNNHHFQKVLEKAKITKKVTMHIARHSFGNIAKTKISIPTLQLLFRHTDIKTTYGYMANFINDETDNALDAVLGV
jgi:integrase